MNVEEQAGEEEEDIWDLRIVAETMQIEITQLVRLCSYVVLVVLVWVYSTDLESTQCLLLHACMSFC